LSAQTWPLFHLNIFAIARHFLRRIFASAFTGGRHAHVLTIALHITSVWTTFSEAIFLSRLLRWGPPLDQSMLLHQGQRMHDAYLRRVLQELRMRGSPSIVPNEADQDTYLVLAGSGARGARLIPKALTARR
jgi:hypothetical protein